MYNMEPFIWRMRLKYNISAEAALRRFAGRRCLMCGKELRRNKRGRPRKFCSRSCKYQYDNFERTRKQIIRLEEETELSQGLGTIYIRPKYSGESWQQYHQYLQSLKPWIVK